MRCATCGKDNREGRRFCAECGAPMAFKCSRCGASNEPDEKFCGECGATLSTGPRPPAAEPESAPAVRIAAQESGSQSPQGERKTVTALFADIKGSMELMEDLDPEEARAIVDPALRLMIDAVHRYDGYIVQSTGDGIFALFGAPVAHEDHPQRALYAALRMQEEMRRYSAKLRVAGNPPIEARVGVNTGEVVVRSIATGDGHAEYTPIGHSTNLAARMQVLAPTGSVAATEHVRKLCEGYFVFKDLGPTSVKGVAGQVNVFEVVGLGALRTRLQVSARRGLTKFVGRHSELEQMKHALELAKSGHGQVAVAMGEPGVGKSRLFFEFKAMAQSGCLVLEAYSVSHGKASAYLPVLELLKGYFKMAAEDDERTRREKVNGKIITLDRALEDTIPYLFALLGIVEGDDPLAQTDPQLRRRRTLEAIKRILTRESLNQPLIVIFEDLHWIDSETQALLNLLVDGIATARVLLLFNYRPEYQHQWNNKTYYAQLRLDPLGKESADEMLTALLSSDHALPDQGQGPGEGITSLKRLIMDRTEGNPFFMEEMVQTLFEQGVLVRNGAVKLEKPLDQIRVPLTVQAILAARIDRLPTGEKDLLQTLAVLGREFSLGLIKRVATKSEDELERMLSELQLGEFIYEQPAIPDIEYTFKHALTQEVAYNSVLTERRRILHESAAQGIETLFAGQLEDHVAELAHHFDRSGNLPKAVEYQGRTGTRAMRQSAYFEAIGHFTRALELLDLLPVSIDRDRQELELQMNLAQYHTIATGAGAPQREAALTRAQDLCTRVGDNARLMEALLALASCRITQRQFPAAQQLSRQALAVAEQAKAPAMIGGAHCQLGTMLFMSGQFEEARRHCERAVELFGPPPFRNAVEFEYGLRAAGVLGGALLMLGYPATALKRAGDTMAAARRLSDPFQVVHALFMSFMVYFNIRDAAMVIQQADELVSLTAEHGMGVYLFQAAFFRGWGKAAAGKAEEGIAEMRRALADTKVSVGNYVFPPMLAGIAEACAKSGRAEEGLAAVAEGLRTADETGERSLEGDLHRIKGELLLVRDPGNSAEAERCFRTAIDVARRQSAKLWELRATMSLARLLKPQGKTEEARKMLAEIYNWFTEGFDTADLKDAKALLDEFAARPEK